MIKIICDKCGKNMKNEGKINFTNGLSEYCIHTTIFRKFENIEYPQTELINLCNDCMRIILTKGLMENKCNIDVQNIMQDVLLLLGNKIIKVGSETDMALTRIKNNLLLLKDQI